MKKEWHVNIVQSRCNVYRKQIRIDNRVCTIFIPVKLAQYHFLNDCKSTSIFGTVVYVARHPPHWVAHIREEKKKFNKENVSKNLESCHLFEKTIRFCFWRQWSKTSITRLQTVTFYQCILSNRISEWKSLQKSQYSRGTISNSEKHPIEPKWLYCGYSDGIYLFRIFRLESLLTFFTVNDSIKCVFF